MTDRQIDLSIEVPGTPEEVWRAIATGPGITSWFVPARVEEREGGRIALDFGGGAEEEGEVTAWEPPHRFAYSSSGERSLGFEWLVEARDGGSCVVRLVNSGFGPGEDWDADFDGMSDGWPIFLRLLHLHLAHFPDRPARAVTPVAMVPGPVAAAFEATCAALGIPADLQPGDRLATSGPGVPALAGRVDDVRRSERVAVYTLLVEEPAPGTAFIAAEGPGELAAVSVWVYERGDGGAIAGEGWATFLNERLAADAPAAAPAAAPTP